MSDPNLRKSSGPTNRRGGCGKSIAILAVAVVLMALFSSGMELFWKRFDERRYRWAFPSPGRATVAGVWTGSLVTGGGQRRDAWFELRYVPRRMGSGGVRRGRSRGSIRGIRLDGLVVLCGGGTRNQVYSIYGNSEDRTGRLTQLSLTPVDSIPPDGIAPSHLRVRWGGGDLLDVEADVHLRRGKSAITSTDDPDTGRPARMTLRRLDSGNVEQGCGPPQ